LLDFNYLLVLELFCLAARKENRKPVLNKKGKEKGSALGRPPSSPAFCPHGLAAQPARARPQPAACPRLPLPFAAATR